MHQGSTDRRCGGEYPACWLTLLAGLLRLDPATQAVQLADEAAEDGPGAAGRVAALPEAGGVSDGVRGRVGGRRGATGRGAELEGGHGAGGALLALLREVRGPTIVHTESQP